ncbi:la-related protein 4B-like [Limulus polyphemus]|uniref:La-related protein 4B-like n=1 Tax=Limulus polyphemus TaxID=6850 RepID=A0ABM1RYG0_LIMPO|nr:la-related protein 4B-like [Limulus polyphemus]XP_022236403.1 la-related protein 4B-like [Limulus polyphemus]XP_022236412.1 la-related protein 4B-like [Limulus polyphemus]XP_022236415.1 la-related protein 4B-like [Limulus polyphemus]
MDNNHPHSEQAYEAPYMSGSQSGEDKPSLPELKAMLQRQLEYYFSRENLSHDTFLLSQMDSDQYVPIITVANFNQVRHLTRDLKLIVEVLRKSPNVEVDEAGVKVRPNHNCCVLILREIPETTAVKDIEALFSGDDCPKSAKCEFAHNDSWYVTFESDGDVQKAYRYLREEVRTFQGKPIMARIKVKPATQAPFIPHYKNGSRYRGPMVSPVSGQQEPSPPLQQQWMEQSQQGLPYTNEPSVPYGNQQVFPPFYPPTMIQNCAPANPPTFEYGTILLMNGLSAQAMLNGTGRHELHASPGRTQKPQIYRNQHKHTSLSLEQKESMSFAPNPRGAAPILNQGMSGFGYLPYPYCSPYSIGMDMQDIFSYSKRYSLQHKQGQWGSNPSSLSYGVKSASRSFNRTKEAIDNKVANQTKSVNELQGRDLSKQQRNRPRRKRKDENNTKADNDMKGSDNRDVKLDSSKFDLEQTSFPPLPGLQVKKTVDALDTDLFESQLSDPVQTTSKSSDGDNRSETEVSSDHKTHGISQAKPASSIIDKGLFNSSNLANGACSCVEPKQPSLDPLTTQVEPQIKLQSTNAHSSSTNKVGTVTSTGNSDMSVMSTDHTISSNLVGSHLSSVPTTCSSPQPDDLSCVSTKILAIQPYPVSKPSQKDNESFLVNGNIDLMGTINISSDDKRRKLTYSEVAQKAKESVEKLATEIKIKEQQEIASKLQRHTDVTSKHQVTAHKTSPKEVAKWKTTEQPSNCKDNDSNTGNGSRGIEKDCLPRLSPRLPLDDKKEENIISSGKTD